MSRKLNKVFIIAALVLVFCSCKEKKSQKSDVSANSEKSQVAHSNAHLGAWINENYALAVTENLSPYLSQKKLEGITELKIQKTDILVVEDNTEAQTFKYKKKDDSLLLANGNTFVLSDNKLKSPSGKIFLKASSEIPDESVLNHFVRSNLISGEYTSDLDGDDETIQLKADGSVTGWPDYKSFKVHTTFAELGAMDIIEFASESGAKDFFSWQMRNQNIVLYALEPGTDYLFKRGEKTGILKRKGNLNI